MILNTNIFKHITFIQSNFSISENITLNSNKSDNMTIYYIIDEYLFSIIIIFMILCVLCYLLCIYRYRYCCKKQ